MSTPTHEPYYKTIGQEHEVFNLARAFNLPLMLKGPTGCGKSRFVEYAAYKADNRLIQVSCNEDTSATDLLGRFLLKGGDTQWQDGPVTRAVREGWILYLDEIAEAREDVVVLLHSLTDHRRELYLDRTNEILKAPKKFQLIVSMNPGYQRGFKELKPSTRQRFLSLAFHYPDEQAEAEIIEHESGVAPSVARPLAKLGKQVRSLGDLNVTETVSTRLLVNVAKLIAGGLPPRLACEVGMIQPLSDDPNVIRALQDLVALKY